MPFIRQASFAGGEISPSLWGRSDLAKYHVALKTMRNFFVTRQGAAMSRPGTTYVGEVKNSAAGKVRLIPFVYSDTLTFVLEFGNRYVRVYSNSAYLGEISAGSGYVNTAIPYLTADLPNLKFAQIGAVLSLTHPSYAPAELTYNGPGSWAFANVAFDRPALRTSGAGQVLREPVPSGPAAWNAATAYAVGAYATQDGHSYRATQANTNKPIVIGLGQVDNNNWVLDDSRGGKEWQWMLTTLTRDSRGVIYESAPLTIQSMGFPWYGAWNSQVTYNGGGHGIGTQVISNGGADGGVNGTIYRAIANNVNTQLNQAGLWVVDNVDLRPPTPYQFDTLPSVIPVGPDRPVTIDTSGITAYSGYVTTRVYRGAGGFFGWVGDTATGTFTDYGAVPDYTRQPPQGTNPFKVNGGAAEYPACVTFFEGRRFFARSNNRPGFFWGSVVNDYANFDTPNIPLQSSSFQFEIASRKLEEIRFLVSVGPRLLMGTQSAIWSAVGSGGPMSFNSIDVKKQLEVGSSWLDPLIINGTALFVRTKGTGVRSMTYDFTRNAFLDSDLSIMAAHLFIGYQVVDWCIAEDPWNLIHAVRNDGIMLTLTYLKDQDEWAWSMYDSPAGAGLFENTCSVPEGLEDAVYVVVNRTVNGAVHRYIERFATRVVTPATMNQTICLDCAGIYNGAATTSITGLTWLKGQSVYVLADGNVDGPFPVDNTGAITLKVAASYVIAGLAYTPQLQQLNPATQALEVKTLNKQVARAAVEVDNTRGLAIGPDFNNLVEWPQRQVADNFGAVPLATSQTKQWIFGNWGTDGSVCIQQNWPLPVTVEGITREVIFGDA